jgi:hypothetical protein
MRRFTYYASEQGPGAGVSVPVSGGGDRGYIADVSKASRFVPSSNDWAIVVELIHQDDIDRFSRLFLT